MKNILLLTDFSEDARNAIIYAVELFGDKNVEYTLLNAYSEITVSIEVFVSMKDILEEQSKRGLDKELKIIHSIFSEKSLIINKRSVYGELPESIHSLLDEVEFDYGVMGTKGQTAETWMLGSVAKRMVKEAQIPFIIIPEKAKYSPISDIVFASDLKVGESYIVKQIVNIAKINNARITILHIDEQVSEGDKSIKELEGIAKKVNYDNITLVELIEENIADAIINFNDENNTDLLVLTTYTRNVLSTIFHQSVTKKMLKHSHVPMLIFNRKKFDYIFLG